MKVILLNVVLLSQSIVTAVPASFTVEVYDFKTFQPLQSYNFNKLGYYEIKANVGSCYLDIYEEDVGSKNWSAYFECRNFVVNLDCFNESPHFFLLLNRKNDNGSAIKLKCNPD